MEQDIRKAIVFLREHNNTIPTEVLDFMRDASIEKYKELTAKKPSDFTKYPYGSVSGKAEAETVARNIMVILERTGNIFKELTWDEYKAERQKDKGFSGVEELYFKEVIQYCKSAETAKLFSKEWNKN